MVSEILDPLRRQTVAEVLAIDTSGSMGACHCAEEGVNNGLGGDNRVDGGVKKTSIAQNAAARAHQRAGRHRRGGCDQREQPGRMGDRPPDPPQPGRDR